jgi:hypothetical protein
MICRRRVAYRVVEIYNALPETKPAPVRAPRITRSVERDHTGARVRATYCDGWAI